MENKNQDVSDDDLTPEEMLQIEQQQILMLGTKRESQDDDNTVVKKKKSSDITPLRKYRGKCLWVSDLMKQYWCENQAIYTFRYPDLIKPSPVVETGQAIHLSRELEVHDIVKVVAYTPEDRFAVKCLNILTSIKLLKNGNPCVREMDIFGIPFNSNIFFIGKIDELRYDYKNNQIDVHELKTRASNSSPSFPTQMPHHFQVMLYKLLLDDMIKNKISKETVASKMKLDLNRKINESVTKSTSFKSLNTVGTILDHLFELMQEFQPVNNLSLEYIYQKTKATIGSVQVQNNPQWLQEKFEYFVEYWQGKRQPRGVDIEDAWKCNSCRFYDICDWRKDKIGC